MTISFFWGGCYTLYGITEKKYKYTTRTWGKQTKKNNKNLETGINIRVGMNYKDICMCLHGGWGGIEMSQCLRNWQYGGIVF